jgi:hypothetical protein
MTTFIATYERHTNDGWVEETCNTDYLENDSGSDWTKSVFRNYLNDTRSSGKIRNIVIVEK